MTCVSSVTRELLSYITRAIQAIEIATTNTKLNSLLRTCSSEMNDKGETCLPKANSRHEIGVLKPQGWRK